MSKILILANSSSGLYGFRNELVLELIKKHEVFASLPDTTNNKELEEEGCKIIQTDINRRGMNPFQDIRLLRSYLIILREIKPDVVLTYTIKPNVYGGLACRIKKVPYMVNMTGLGSALENPGILQIIAKALYRIGLKRANVVFAQNSSNLKFIEDNKLSKAPKVLLPGSGVNIDRFKPLDWPTDKLRFVFISRVMKEKGIEEYLECAKVMHSQDSDIEFHILGYCEEDYEDRLKQLDKDGVIRYHGNVSDVRDYLKDVRCIIHPSYYPEGMSNVCLEAAACARAVITTDRPGCRETVDDKRSGFIVPVRDKEALIRAVRSFVNMSPEEQRQMGLASRKYIEDNFNRKIVVDAYVDRIDTILSNAK